MNAVNPYLLFKKNIYSLHGKSTNLHSRRSFHIVLFKVSLLCPCEHHTTGEGIVIDNNCDIGMTFTVASLIYADIYKTIKASVHIGFKYFSCPGDTSHNGAPPVTP